MLIRLAVAGIFVNEVGGSGLNLRVHDLTPQPLSLDGFAALALALVLSVKLLEGITPALEEARAFVRAHQSPLTVLLHALHEQVRDPERVEQVTRAVFFCSVVLA